MTPQCNSGHYQKLDSSPSLARCRHCYFFALPTHAVSPFELYIAWMTDQMDHERSL